VIKTTEISGPKNFVTAHMQTSYWLLICENFDELSSTKFKTHWLQTKLDHDGKNITQFLLS
jgi:hypothetical protein